MLCILQTIRQHMEGDVIKKDAFKIVYVAPMKALAAEMTATFGKRYSDRSDIRYSGNNEHLNNKLLLVRYLDVR